MICAPFFLIRRALILLEPLIHPFRAPRKPNCRAHGLATAPRRTVLHLTQTCTGPTPTLLTLLILSNFCSVLSAVPLLCLLHTPTTFMHLRYSVAISYPRALPYKPPPPRKTHLFCLSSHCLLSRSKPSSSCVFWPTPMITTHLLLSAQSCFHSRRFCHGLLALPFLVARCFLERSELYKVLVTKASSTTSYRSCNTATMHHFRHQSHPTYALGSCRSI